QPLVDERDLAEAVAGFHAGALLAAVGDLRLAVFDDEEADATPVFADDVLAGGEVHLLERVDERLEVPPLEAREEIDRFELLHSQRHGADSMQPGTRFTTKVRRRGALDGARQGRRARSYPADTGATEDTALRQPARRGGSRLHCEASSFPRALLRGLADVSPRELLDLALGGVEPGRAEPVELLAALPQPDRLVERHVAALQSLDDRLELALCGLERRRRLVRSR